VLRPCTGLRGQPRDSCSRLPQLLLSSHVCVYLLCLQTKGPARLPLYHEQPAVWHPQHHCRCLLCPTSRSTSGSVSEMHCPFSSTTSTRSPAPHLALRWSSIRYLFLRLRLQMRLGLYWHRTQEVSPQPELLRSARATQGHTNRCNCSRLHPTHVCATCVLKNCNACPEDCIWSGKVRGCVVVLYLAMAGGWGHAVQFQLACCCTASQGS